MFGYFAHAALPPSQQNIKTMYAPLSDPPPPSRIPSPRTLVCLAACPCAVPDAPRRYQGASSVPLAVWVDRRAEPLSREPPGCAKSGPIGFEVCSPKPEDLLLGVKRGGGGGCGFLQYVPELFREAAADLCPGLTSVWVIGPPKPVMRSRRASEGVPGLEGLTKTG